MRPCGSPVGFLARGQAAGSSPPSRVRARLMECGSVSSNSISRKIRLHYAYVKGATADEPLRQPGQARLSPGWPARRGTGRKGHDPRAAAGAGRYQGGVEQADPLRRRVHRERRVAAAPLRQRPLRHDRRRQAGNRDHRLARSRSRRGGAHRGRHVPLGQHPRRPRYRGPGARRPGSR